MNVKFIPFIFINFRGERSTFIFEINDIGSRKEITLYNAEDHKMLAVFSNFSMIGGSRPTLFFVGKRNSFYKGIVEFLNEVG